MKRKKGVMRMSHGLGWVLVNFRKDEPGEEALEADLRKEGFLTPGIQGSQGFGA